MQIKYSIMDHKTQMYPFISLPNNNEWKLTAYIQWSATIAKTYEVHEVQILERLKRTTTLM